jgi:hypothetical protein
VVLIEVLPQLGEVYLGIDGRRCFNVRVNALNIKIGLAP